MAKRGGKDANKPNSDQKQDKQKTEVKKTKQTKEEKQVTTAVKPNTRSTKTDEVVPS